jgi:methylated-DNA-protein-cysteine methyltransferase-like protein
MTPARPDSRADRIIKRVRAIPAGFVRTYGDIDPEAPRLVGRILATHYPGDDPRGERVPWHRVVRADGRVPRGEVQLALLRHEGVPLSNDRVDLRRARVPLNSSAAHPRNAK